MYIAFLSPVVIAFLVAYLYPVCRTVQMSFFEVSDISSSRDTWNFVGLYNYKDLFSRQLFLVSFRNMLLIFLVGGAFVFLISLFFAWVLHKGMFMGSFWRNLIYLPTVITPVAMITVWTQYVYNNRYGLLRTIFEALGLDALANIPWTSTQYAFWSMLIAYIFCSIGGNLLVYMAAMKKVPEELYEAAKVDGAGFWQTQWSITLPLLAPTLRIWVFLSMIGSLQLFDLVNIIWGSYISETAGVSTMATYMVRNGRDSGNYGYGSAVAIIIFIISLVVALVYQKFVLNRDLEGALTEQKQAKKRAAKRAKEAQRLAASEVK